MKTYKRVKYLKKHHADDFRGLEWLEKNRHLFIGEAYGPMYLYLNAGIEFVRNSIDERDLLAFICESRDDFETLVIQLREKRNLRISVVSALPIKSENVSQQPAESKISGPRIIVDFLQKVTRDEMTCGKPEKFLE